MLLTSRRSQVAASLALIAMFGGVSLSLGSRVATPSVPERVSDEAFWRMAIGRKFTQGEFGRIWSPMIDVLASHEFVADAKTHWDVAPQMQVTLSTRQHIMVNAGVRIPMNEEGRG